MPLCKVPEKVQGRAVAFRGSGASCYNLFIVLIANQCCMRKIVHGILNVCSQYLAVFIDRGVNARIGPYVLIDRRARARCDNIRLQFCRGCLFSA